jgi:hypothetical protein
MSQKGDVLDQNGDVLMAREMCWLRRVTQWRREGISGGFCNGRIGGLLYDVLALLFMWEAFDGRCGVGSSDFDKIFENCFASCSFGLAKDI